MKGFNCKTYLFDSNPDLIALQLYNTPKDTKLVIPVPRFCTGTYVCHTIELSGYMFSPLWLWHVPGFSQPVIRNLCKISTHLGRHRIADILQSIFPNIFSSMKMFEFGSGDWFKQWLGVKQALLPQPVMTQFTEAYMCNLAAVNQFLWRKVAKFGNCRISTGPDLTCYWKYPLIARFMGLTCGPSGDDRTQVGPMLVPWTLLSGSVWIRFS